jgi:hypothetical protein
VGTDDFIVRALYDRILRREAERVFRKPSALKAEKLKAVKQD